MRIGVLRGRENSYPEAFVAKVNSMGKGVHAEFVQLGGRPGHEGYFPIKGPVRMNVPQTLSVSVSGAPVTAVRLIISAGDTLQRIELPPRDTNADPEDSMAQVTPSHPSFRVVVEGRDASGFPYQRVYPRLMKAQP